MRAARSALSEAQCFSSGTACSFRLDWSAVERRGAMGERVSLEKDAVRRIRPRHEETRGRNIRRAARIIHVIHMNSYLDRHYTGAEVEAIIARVREDERSLKLFGILLGAASGALTVGAIWLIKWLICG